MRKRCTRCKKKKDVEQFHKQKRRNKNGKLCYYTYSKCIPCWRAYLIERSHTSYFRDQKVVRAFNRTAGRHQITVAEYQQMREAQHNRCAICGRPGPKMITAKNRALVLDHDHTTHKVRALLCIACNIGLGCFHDDERVLHMALKYLARHKV